MRAPQLTLFNGKAEALKLRALNGLVSSHMEEAGWTRWSQCAQKGQAGDEEERLSLAALGPSNLPIFEAHIECAFLLLA